MFRNVQIINSSNGIKTSCRLNNILYFFHFWKYFFFKRPLFFLFGNDFLLFRFLSLSFLGHMIRSRRWRWRNACRRWRWKRTRRFPCRDTFRYCCSFLLFQVNLLSSFGCFFYFTDLIRLFLDFPFFMFFVSSSTIKNTRPKRRLNLHTHIHIVWFHTCSFHVGV